MLVPKFHLPVCDHHRPGRGPAGHDARLVPFLAAAALLEASALWRPGPLLHRSNKLDGITAFHRHWALAGGGQPSMAIAASTIPVALGRLVAEILSEAIVFRWGCPVAGTTTVVVDMNPPLLITCTVAYCRVQCVDCNSLSSRAIARGCADRDTSLCIHPSTATQTAILSSLLRQEEI